MWKMIIFHIFIRYSIFFKKKKFIKERFIKINGKKLKISKILYLLEMLKFKKPSNPIFWISKSPTKSIKFWKNIQKRKETYYQVLPQKTPIISTKTISKNPYLNPTTKKSKNPTLLQKNSFSTVFTKSVSNNPT